MTTGPQDRRRPGRDGRRPPSTAPTPRSARPGSRRARTTRSWPPRPRCPPSAHTATAAPAGAPHPDARRSRRPGDVMSDPDAPDTNLQPEVDHDDCGSRSSADFTAIPSQLLAIPASALSGFPNGKNPRELSRRRLLARGHRRRRLRVRRDAPRLELGLRVGGRRGRRDAEEPRRDLPAGRQRRAQRDGARSTPSTPATRRPRPNIARVVGPSAGGKVGTLDDGRHRRQPRLRERRRVDGPHGRQRRPDARLRQPLRRWLGGAGSDLAIFPAADYTPSNHSHFESADIWFGGSIDKQVRRAGSAAGSTTTARRRTRCRPSRSTTR